MKFQNLNQSQIKKNPRKFSFLIIMGIISCFFIPIPIVNIVFGIVVLILYLEKGNEETSLGKFLKVFGITNLIFIVLGLILFGACIFTISGM